MTTDRADPPLAAGEREMLAAWLDYHRATLARKCDGLDAAQLRERSVPPSSLSLLGLVRHMAETERGWFRRGVLGEDAPPRYYHDDNPDGDFDDAGTADPAEAFAAWREECEQARRAEAAAPSLDAGFERRDRRYTLRWVMVHMIEEYARHNGHADLLRERIDGATGD
ncbi:MAG TPA: DinB family protein [Streptosporangiaceae bacterium]|jgi:uncharacterized damage-inducible protein DinB|nr:DinB family protein [Streptosporangiaceae bacterium]